MSNIKVTKAILQAYMHAQIYYTYIIICTEPAGVFKPQLLLKSIQRKGAASSLYIIPDVASLFCRSAPLLFSSSHDLILIVRHIVSEKRRSHNNGT